ncbi:tetratricopeptide repeat protein [Terriglobus sp.]|uniref:tetratricopeptide repeat protein n=1 Tax=Terriglobus sp. TaxID=1889013 RepID=UPI003B003A78
MRLLSPNFPALLLLLTTAGIGGAQSQHGTTAARSGTRAATQKAANVNAGVTAGASAGNVPGNVGGRLDVLTRMQSAAVQSGDPVQIALSSRELNAELLNLLGTIAAGENRITEAVDLDRRSLALHPDDDVALRLASLLAHTGRADEGIRIAEQVAETNPKNPRAFTTLASILRSLHRDHDAIAPLRTALQLDPSPSIAFALGSAMLSAHDKAGAEQVFQRLLAASDGAAIWHVAIGDAYRETDYLEEAAAEFRKALLIDPHATHAEFFLGLVSLQMNEWGPNSESFLHLRKAVEQNPHEYLSNFYLGALESTDGSDLPSSDSHLHAAAAADASQPEVWIYLGQNANREHQNEQAIADLRKAVELTGTDEERNHFQIRRAYFSLGRLLIAAGKHDEGEKYLADYRRTGEASAAQATAAIAEKQSSAASTLNGQAPSESLRYLANATATTQAATVVATQDTAAVSPQLRSAEAQLRAMLRNGYNDLGTAEARQQDYAQALHDFQQAERFGEASPALLHNIAVAAYRLNDPAEVQRALTEYFGTTPAPQDSRARMMLAMANFDLGHFGEAAHDFHAAGDAALGDPRTTYSYALSLARDGQAQQANALADRLVASANLSPDKLALVCNVYFLAENYESSQSCYGKAAQQDPALQRAHYFVGESLIHLDRPAEAIPALQAELALSPGEPNVETSLAFALSQTGHKDEAMALLDKTVAAHPENAEAQYQLGKLLAEQGKTADAIPHLEASVQRDANKDYAHYQLATALRKAGRTADAEREFAIYRQIKDKHRNDRAAPKGAQPERQAP